MDRLNEIQFSLSTILRTTRKYYNLKQSEISSKLNVNQSTYSKIERGQTSTSVENWLMFAHLLNINFDAPILGIIDLSEPIIYGNKVLRGSFAFPDRFIDNSSISCRLFLLVIEHKIRIGEGSILKDYFNSRVIDPDYFRVAQNSFNVRFLEDFFSYLSFETLSKDEGFFSAASLKSVFIGHLPTSFLNKGVFEQYFSPSILNFEVNSASNHEILLKIYDHSYDTNTRSILRQFVNLFISAFNNHHAQSNVVPPHSIAVRMKVLEN